jgi:hypothetical protein
MTAVAFRTSFLFRLLSPAENTSRIGKGLTRATSDSAGRNGIGRGPTASRWTAPPLRTAGLQTAQVLRFVWGNDMCGRLHGIFVRDNLTVAHFDQMLGPPEGFSLRKELQEAYKRLGAEERRTSESGEEAALEIFLTTPNNICYQQNLE